METVTIKKVKGRYTKGDKGEEKLNKK